MLDVFYKSHIEMLVMIQILLLKSGARAIDKLIVDTGAIRFGLSSHPYSFAVAKRYC